MLDAEVRVTDGGNVRGATTAGLTQGCRLAAEHGLRAARNRVPLEEGTLERSGRASVGTHGGEVAGAVSFDTPYAVRQHEDLTLQHDAGRTAKYLEGPLQEERAVLLAIIGRAVRQSWGT